MFFIWVLRMMEGVITLKLSFNIRSDRLYEGDCESAIAPHLSLVKGAIACIKLIAKLAILILNPRRSNTLNKLTLTDEK